MMIKCMDMEEQYLMELLLNIMRDTISTTYVTDLEPYITKTVQENLEYGTKVFSKLNEMHLRT